MTDMSARITAILNKLGMKMEYWKRSDKSASATIYGVLQPLLYKNKLYVEMQPSAIGPVDDGCYLYLGPAKPRLQAEDFIYAKGKKFVVQRYERVYLSSKPLYSWAIVRPSITTQTLVEEDD